MFQDLSERLDSIVSGIEKRENRIEQIAKDIENSTQEIKKQIKPIKLNNISIAGVDGGLLKKEYTGVSLIITRAVGVIFNYKDEKLKTTDYIPSATIQPSFTITEPLKDTHELDQKASIIRINEEINRAIECCNKKPDIILLDGTIIPHPGTEPSTSSDLTEDYQNLTKKIEELIEICIKQKILLCGICEDSRSDTFCKTLDIKDKCTDTEITNYLLKKDERTITYRTEMPKQFKNMKDLIHNIIIKPSEFDKPVRIQFIAKSNPEDTAENISSIIDQISCHHSEYAAPTVLIEADQRAKLNPEEIMFIENEIRTRLGKRSSTLLDLRRNRRPF